MKNYQTSGNMQQMKYLGIKKAKKIAINMRRYIKNMQNCAQVFKNMKNYAKIFEI